MLQDPRAALTQWFQRLKRFSRILWVRVALIAALSVLAALSAELVEPLIPDGPKDRFTQGAILPILNILASGMLAVTTFSLGVMVSSHRTLAEQSTPRVHRLLMEDTSTQTMLATFIGAFVFSLSSIILFRSGYYSDSAAVIVFGATVLVVTAIVVSLVRWIGQLSRIGSLEYALDRAEKAAKEVLDEMRRWPLLGGSPGNGERPENAKPIPCDQSGYLGRIDMEHLQSCAEARSARIHIAALPGKMVLKDQPLGWIVGSADTDGLAKAFVMGASRTVEQDPRYALIVLREAASKALSPGINDQGTAIEVIARLERRLWDWSDEDKSEEPEPVFPRVFVPALEPGSLVVHAFRTIARDGAAHDDVLIAMTRSLSRLRKRMPEQAHEMIDLVLGDIDAHGSAALRTQIQKERLNRALAEAGYDQAALE